LALASSRLLPLVLTNSATSAARISSPIVIETISSTRLNPDCRHVPTHGQ
jgi:hypothetical protein